MFINGSVGHNFMWKPPYIEGCFACEEKAETGKPGRYPVFILGRPGLDKATFFT